MINKISELIEQGVATFKNKPLAHKLPQNDPMCVQYMNRWGILTDTSMQFIDDERFITGHMVKTERFKKLLTATQWGSAEFSRMGYTNLNDFLNTYQYQGEFSEYNGDIIYKLTPIQID